MASLSVCRSSKVLVYCLDNEGLPIYIPSAPVCRAPQYHCCTHGQHCRLYPICSKMSPSAGSICKRDCPSCDYKGCSMSAQDRIEQPLYQNHITLTWSEPIDDVTFFREQRKHKEQHHRMYEYYNKIFGDLNERRAARARERYHKDPERYRQQTRNWYNKHCKSNAVPTISEDIMPPCHLDCENCPHDDCVLPENWEKQARYKRWLANNPDYHQRYREKHREQIRTAGKDYYATHKAEILKRRREHRQKPEVKAARNAYDKAYNQAHPEKKKAKSKRYYEAHKDEINARKREKRRAAKQ